MEEFEPDKIKVKLAGLKSTGHPGDTLRFPLKAAYYFGSDCSEHRYDYRFRLRHVDFYSQRYNGFRFAPSNVKRQTLESLRDSGTLDGKGRDTVDYYIPIGMKSPGRISGTLSVTVHDNTGRTVSRSRSLNIITRDSYVGIRTHGRYFSVYDNFKLDMIAVDNFDKVKSGMALLVEVRRFDWKRSLRRTGSRYYHVAESEPIVERKDTVYLGSDYHRFRMRIEKAGNYEVRVSTLDGDDLQTTTFSAYGKELATATSFGVNREGTVNITFDKESYKTGESARILFSTPFSGRMLVTMER
ncbi:MAG: hypothetical protein AAF570_25950, partial [Bacteroidota bacterium]